MLQSMTGYGKAISELPHQKITVDIRSLNSKQGEINLRLPSLFRDKEMDIRQLVGSQLDRGKIDVLIDVLIYYEDKSEKSDKSINPDAFKRNYHLLKSLANELDINTNDWLSVLTSMPDSYSTQTDQVADDLWDLLFNLVENALEELVRFRLKEGKALEADVSQRIETIRSLIKQTELMEDERNTTMRSKMNAKWNEWINDQQLIDENRLEQELFYYLEKIDITEEKVRLNQHCDFFIDSMSNESGNGRKLGFIAQEIGREINTIGSKANHAGVQRLVVEMKTELEKIKEQLSNIV
jgi:uncharacterized protein (TIGR00255 family)